MNVISRVSPNTSETSKLYIKFEKVTSTDIHTGNSKIILHEGNTISLNTYFNSIYETYYTKYTTISSLYYLLKLEGDFEVSAYRETYEASKELINSQTFKDCQSEYVKIDLQELKASPAGRIYLEIKCLGEQGLFTGVKQHVHNRVVAFPSLAVWHEPGYAKKPAWDAYYSSRNQLITNSIHGSLRYLNAVKNLSIGIIYNLLIFYYNTAQMYIKAFEDYMQGPNFIRSNDPEILHTQCEYGKSHKSQTILTNANFQSDVHPVNKAGKAHKILSLLTLNGHLLAKFIIRNESALIHYGKQEHDSICKGFAKKRVIFLKDKNPHCFQNELDNQAGINILLCWVKSVIRSIWKWSDVSAEWKTSAQDLTSIQFWQDYLEPHQ